MSSLKSKPSGSSSEKSGRLNYIDWMRGLAAVIMLQGHTFHSFLRNDLRGESPYVLSQFVGGLPPAVFLFLTGVTLAFRMDGAERKNLPMRQRFFGAWNRAFYLISIAFLFRFQLWLFAWPNNSWTDIFRVDILNCMALSVALLSAMVVFRTVDRIRLCAVLGLAIAAASPIASAIDYSLVPPIVKQYLAPDTLFFGFFPWAAFLAFGMSFGSIIRTVPDENMDRVMQWSAIFGAALIMGARYFADLPYSLYTKSDFWINSPALILIKLGVMLWIMTFAFLWTRYVSSPGWSWIRQLGTTSLLVYWVHVELVYGRWFWPWKENLDVLQTVIVSVGIILLMLLLSVLSTKKWSARRASFGWYPFVSSRQPQRAD